MSAEAIKFEHGMSEIEINAAPYGLWIEVREDGEPIGICVGHERAKQVRDLLLRLYPIDQTRQIEQLTRERDEWLRIMREVRQTIIPADDAVDEALSSSELDFVKAERKRMVGEA